MILGLTCWYEVNLRSAVMIRDPLNTRFGLTFSLSATMIRDPLDTRSGLTFSLSAIMIRDPLDTRSDLTLYFSAVMIRSPLVLKRSRLRRHFCFLLSFKLWKIFSSRTKSVISIFTYLLL